VLGSVPKDEARGGKTLLGLAQCGHDVAKVADKLTVEVGRVFEGSGVFFGPGEEKTIEVSLLICRGIWCPIDKERHAMMQGDESLPLRVGDAGEVAESRAEFGLVVEEAALVWAGPDRFEVIFDGLRICHRAGFFADEVNHGCAFADVIEVELLDRVCGGLAEVFLHLNLAVSSR
jgi:hypothetical protein